jgi:hypothetical protein
MNFTREQMLYIMHHVMFVGDVTAGKLLDRAEGHGNSCSIQGVNIQHVAASPGHFTITRF